MVGFMQALFPKQMLSNPMVKSTAISDAGITNQTLLKSTAPSSPRHL